MDSLKEKKIFLDKKGISLAVLSVIFVGVFILGIFFYFGSGNLTGEVVSESLFGDFFGSNSLNLVEIQSESNPSCVGETKNFTCGDAITESCTMNGNLTSEGDCFNVSANDIIIDCAGYSITGILDGNCFYLENLNNSFIKNCSIFDFYTGFLIGNVYNSSFIKNTLSGVQEGFFVDSSTSNYFYDNFFYDQDLSTGENGFTLYGTSNNSFVRNNFSNIYGGISLSGSNNDSFLNNTLYNSEKGESGISVADSENLSFVGNNIFNFSVGFSSSGSKNSFFKNNSFVDAEFVPISDSDEIEYYSHDIDTSNLINGKPIYYFSGSLQKECKNFEIDSSDLGVLFLINCSNVTVKNSNIFNVSTGITLFNTYNSSFINNNLSSHQTGFSISSSQNNTFVGNLVSNCLYGISVQPQSIGNLFIDNTLLNVSEEGFGVYTSSNNSFIENILIGVLGDEMSSIGFSIVFSENNSFLKNNLSTEKVGFYLSRSKNNLFADTILQNVLEGFELYDTSKNNSFVNNTLNNGSIGFKTQSSNAVNNFFTNNSIFNYSTGFSLSPSNNNSFIDNFLFGSFNGFYLSLPTTANNYFSGNILSNFSNGISLNSAQNNSFFNNLFSSNSIGIFSEASSGNLFFENSFYENEIGFSIQTSNNNSLFFNNFFNNSLYGVMLNYSSNNTLSNNLFYLNSILDIVYDGYGTNFGTDNICNNSGDWFDLGVSEGCFFSSIQDYYLRVKIANPVQNAVYVSLDKIDYSVSGEGLDSCWYSFDSGETNSSAVVAGNSFTGLDLPLGNYNLIVYCNDSYGNLDEDNLNFIIGDYGFTEEVDKLLASDGVEDDLFGTSVSISGDYAIVGAYYDDDKGNESGSAYIFKRNLTTGTFEQVDKLLADDGAKADDFSYSVSISGDYAIIGATGDDDKGSDSGSAYIFKKNLITDKFEQIDKLLADDGAAADYFGGSVSISGDYAIVGASWDDDKGSSSGSAYIFKRNLTTDRFEEVNKINASDGEELNMFGYSVSISGDYAIVGAYRIGNGSAYIFKRNLTTGTFEQVDKLLADDGAKADYFGYSVSISGDYAIVGAYGDNGSRGSAYIFKRNLTVDKSDKFKQVDKITASDGEELNMFGYSVSISGDYAIVGAHYDDDKGNESGSAYIYNLYSCISSLKNTSYSFSNISCSGAEKNQMNQSRKWTEYDENNCGTFTNITYTDYQLVGPTYQNETSWTMWRTIGCINETNFYNQTRNLTSYDLYGCADNITYIEYRDDNVSCNCVQNLVNTTASSWTNISCLSDNKMNQSQNWTEYDYNGCGFHEPVVYTIYRAIEFCNYSQSICTENWSCTNWSSCVGGIKNRTCIDSNSCGTQINKPAESSSCSPGSPGSGPSGSSSNVNTVSLDFASSFIKKSNSLNKNDKVLFYTSDSSSHSLEFNRISGNRAYFTIRSDPISFDLGIGEEKYLDLDGDNKNDFYIRLESISSNKVVVSTQAIKVNSPIVENSDTDDSSSDEEETDSGNDEEENVLPIFDPSKRRIFFISAISILVIGILVVLYFLVNLIFESSRDKKYSLREEVKKLIGEGNSFVSLGKKQEALVSYEKARKIFEANKKYCGDLFGSLKSLYDSILRMR